MHSVGMTETEVDVVQIAAFLLWASRESGGVRPREIALNHARLKERLLMAEKTHIQPGPSQLSGGRVVRFGERLR